MVVGIGRDAFVSKHRRRQEHLGRNLEERDIDMGENGRRTVGGGYLFRCDGIRLRLEYRLRGCRNDRATKGIAPQLMNLANQSSEPTPSSGTPPAVQESRLR